MKGRFFPLNRVRLQVENVRLVAGTSRTHTL